MRRFDTIGFEQSGSYRLGAAVSGTDGQTQLGQIGQALELHLAPGEQPQRLAVHHAEAAEFGPRLVGQGQFLAALHQGQLDFPLAELGQVVFGALAF